MREEISFDKHRAEQERAEKERAERIQRPKSIVFTLINAESGEARSRVIPNVKGDTLWLAIEDQVRICRERVEQDGGRIVQVIPTRR